MIEANEKRDAMSLTAEAYAQGHDTGGRVAEATGMKPGVAATCLTWLRKAGGDADGARRMRNAYQNSRITDRYRSDPEFRATEKARSCEYFRRQRELARLAVEAGLEVA